MAKLLDPSEPEVQAAVDSARQILTRLGAKPFLARLEGAMARQADKAPSEIIRATSTAETASA